MWAYNLLKCKRISCNDYPDYEGLVCSLIKFRPLDQHPGAQYTILLMLSVLEFRCTEDLARAWLTVTRPHAYAKPCATHATALIDTRKFKALC